MTINVLLILFAILTVVCIGAGIKKGMLTIIYGAVSWIFVFWFIATASPFVQDYIYDKTEIAISVNEKIFEKLEVRYDHSEEEEAGTGTESVLKLVPSSVRNQLRQSVHESVQAFLTAVSNELTGYVVKGIAVVLSIIIAIIVVWIAGILVKGLGSVPGLRTVNKTLGFAAGFVQAILIIWTIMYVAECFSTTLIGGYIVENSIDNKILSPIYEMNLIRTILK